MKREALIKKMRILEGNMKEVQIKVTSDETVVIFKVFDNYFLHPLSCVCRPC